jgi:hypothetical protein
VQAATPTVAELNRFSKGVPELGRNLSLILNHLDDPQYAAEADPRSPGGKGYTGLEALLNYVYYQVLSVNIYDSSVHILKVSPFASDCANYADVKRAFDPSKQVNGTLTTQCGASLGPHAAGVNFPDTTRPDSMAPFGPIPDGQENALSRHQHGDKARAKPHASKPATAAAPTLPPAKDGGAPKPKSVPTLSDVIPGAPPIVLPSPPASVQQIAHTQHTQQAQSKLLDYLLGT